MSGDTPVKGGGWNLGGGAVVLMGRGFETCLVRGGQSSTSWEDTWHSELGPGMVSMSGCQAQHCMSERTAWVAGGGGTTGQAEPEGIWEESELVETAPGRPQA